MNDPTSRPWAEVLLDLVHHAGPPAELARRLALGLVGDFGLDAALVAHPSGAGVALVGADRRGLLPTGAGTWEAWEHHAETWIGASHRQLRRDAAGSPSAAAAVRARPALPWLGRVLDVVTDRMSEVVEQARASRRLDHSERRFQLYVERAYDAVLVVDERARIHYANPAASRIYGYSAAELAALSIPDLIAADEASQAEARAHFGRVVEQGESLGEVRGRRRDGSLFFSDVSAVSLGEGHFLGTIRDSTEGRRFADSLRLFAAVFDSTSEGIVITDASGRIERVNRAFCAMTGWDEAALVGAVPERLDSGRHPPQFYADAIRSLRREGRWEGELWIRRRNGELIPSYVVVNDLRSGDTVEHEVAVITDIRPHKEVEARLTHLALHDPLTNLANRTLLHTRLGEALHRAREAGRRVAVLFIDLDDFKTVNDTLGHDVGDGVLTGVAARLGATVGPDETLARHGGDEFVLLADECQTRDCALRVVRRILDALASPFRVADREIFVSASIGISIFPDDGQTGADLLKNADAAMYRAKAQGHRRFEFFTPEMNRSARARLDTEAGLRRALDSGEFGLVYQPIVRPGERHPRRVEALLRWNQGGTEPRMPGEFVDLAEESGLIVPIDRLVLAEACRQAARWGGGIRVAVNVSPRHFRDQKLAGIVARALDGAGLDGSALELEITERALLHDEAEVTAVFDALHALGVRVVIDDFGTGYSALSYLHRLPIDGLKIDRAFVSELGRNPSHADLVRAILAMAAALGLEVTAEGVETDAQRDFLLEAGCLQLQGYFFGRPMPAEKLPTWRLPER